MQDRQGLGLSTAAVQHRHSMHACVPGTPAGYNKAAAASAAAAVRSPATQSTHLHHPLQADRLAAPLVVLMPVDPCRHRAATERDRKHPQNCALGAAETRAGHAGGPAGALRDLWQQLAAAAPRAPFIITGWLLCSSWRPFTSAWRKPTCRQAAHRGSHLEQGWVLSPAAAMPQGSHRMMIARQLLAASIRHPQPVAPRLPAPTWQASISSTRMPPLLLLPLVQLLLVRASSRR